MRKYRSGLMGLGIGIVLGAMMLQVIIFANNLFKEQSLNEFPSMTYTEEQLKAKVDEAVIAALSQAPKLNDESPVAETATADSPTASPEQTLEKDVKPSEDVTDNPSLHTEEPEAVTLYVHLNMTLTEVAARLEELGVVEDGDDFIDKAWSISTQLRVGTSVFEGKPTYRQIMTELTRAKN
ncbi:MAG: hypothetical protein P0Y55_08975 [Candidatus Cohnella colombiensis]|uniref:Endolytic transglycosylase MltG n=1 Tax=Candidatus Cohnella colombiensis TaxID=3121368 RepID=A0AA95F0T7_9BACL|nr:MAG: hypothetical protein P0Y55_08975 [Cohnella sp.]